MLKGYYKINDSIKMNNGKILNNRFFTEINISRVGQWMILNREEVLRGIKKLLPKQRGVNVDDCFEYCVFVYLNNRDKMFKENYHGVDSKYEIRNYVMGRNLNYMVRSYLMDVKKKNKYLEDIVTSEEKESSGYGRVEDRDMVFSQESNTVDIIFEKEKIELNKKYKSSILLFSRLVRLNKYVDSLDSKELFDNLFLNIQTDSLDEQYEYITKKLNVKLSVLKSIQEDLSIEYKKNSLEVKTLYENISELMEARKNGWTIPLLIEIK